ncbi:polygalacturonase-like [Melia azedarach]|uniref:Polygalacturonase-like n=1 Tax=Melia azedarach TaxID=155640 RepID=A0ACC1YL59_MELAZ|nr:polygalacturonase-like [Melia azedarach]
MAPAGAALCLGLMELLLLRQVIRLLATQDSGFCSTRSTVLAYTGGTFDAKGAGYWACRKAGKSCPPPTRVSWSPNTDGIHIQSSTGITISNSAIRTGDDCISIGPGTKNLWIERITCGPGHGISIGSLGDYLVEEGVENVTVTVSVFTRTQNGLRIKTWARPSNGFVRNIRFQNIRMRSVFNPIIIDQNYCPDYRCPHQSSGVKISGVTYKNIKGTSAKEVAVSLGCSPSKPCTGIKLQDINLTYFNKSATAYCKNAQGSSNGIVVPGSCLS